MTKPYTSLALIYDHVMSHVQYEQWYRYILKIDDKYHFPSREVMEIGGGTGKLAKLFSNTKWKWHVTDISFEMIAEAKKRLSRSPSLTFVQDARYPALSKSKKVGLVVFLYDGFNYLLEIKDIVVCVKAIKDMLVEGGYFLFDVTTETNSLNHFEDDHYFEDIGSYCYMRHAFYNIKTRMQYNQFDIFISRSDGSYIRKTEGHSQRVFRTGEIIGAIKKAGMELVAAWDGYGFKKASKDSERIHFLVKKI